MPAVFRFKPEGFYRYSVSYACARSGLLGSVRRACCFQPACLRSRARPSVDARRPSVPVRRFGGLSVQFRGRALPGRFHCSLAVALRRLLLTFRQSRLTPFGINFDARASTHVFFSAARPLYLLRNTPSHGRYTRRCTSVCFGALLIRASFLSVVYVYFRIRKHMCPSAHAPVAAPACCRSFSPARLFACFRRSMPRSFGRFTWLSPGLVPISITRSWCVEVLSDPLCARLRAAHRGGHLELPISRAVTSIVSSFSDETT